ncbi:uncharacterized protein LOC105163226 [Sesamum indicum]|uniref:Uncharacterized protein LOC105163226 n=1 Tax=Sesamum indicum TaxID=4182 RepID=A0A6I9TBI8_SESIN|nr:uncharacterized protein LOC105163226 [Sesamum indicum]
MNFFKSLLSDDPDPPDPQIVRESDANSALKPPRDGGNSIDVADGGPDDGWSFGGLIRTFAVQSESLIETYRKDLEEFGSGLKKETEILRETASRAVKDLPASLEASATAAHGALDGVLKSTAEIISKEALFGSDGEPETPETNRSKNSSRYSWFEAQLSAIQSDSSTFLEEPEDGEEYRKWKLGFQLEQNRDEIDSLIVGNGVLEDVYTRVVPSAVDPEIFWCRYFYRVYKLKQQESVRANLVKRVISVDDDEELSWDVDEDEDEVEVEVGNGGYQADLKVKGGVGEGDNAAGDGSSKIVEKQEDVNIGSQYEKGGGNVDEDNGENSNVGESGKSSGVDASFVEKEVKSEEGAGVKKDEQLKSEESVQDKKDDKVGMEEKGEFVKKSDAQMASSDQPKVEEEDMGWDEIEDIGSGNEKRISATARGGSPNRGDLRKRLSAAEDDEDLNWDIEDDDEPVKA